MGYTAASAEWLTSSSQQVARAVVADLQFRDAPPIYPNDKPDAWQWVTVTLAVRETLKGEPQERLVLTLRQRRDDLTLRNWHASHAPLLWFLNGAGRERNDITAPESAWAAPHGAAANSLAVELSSGKDGARLPHPVLSMDLTLLDTESKLLDAVRRDVRYRKTEALMPASGSGLSVPSTLMAQTGRSADANALEVPGDERLERLALRWIAGKEPIWKRTDGIDALRQFRTPANEELLLTLLNDPETSTPLDYDTDGKLYHWQAHPLREAAYRVLKSWDVPVDHRPERVRLDEYQAR